MNRVMVAYQHITADLLGLVAFDSLLNGTAKNTTEGKISSLDRSG
jgi:hypothetical protein